MCPDLWFRDSWHANLAGQASESAAVSELMDAVCCNDAATTKLYQNTMNARKVEPA